MSKFSEDVILCTVENCNLALLLRLDFPFIDDKCIREDIFSKKFHPLWARDKR